MAENVERRDDELVAEMSVEELKKQVEELSRHIMMLQNENEILKNGIVKLTLRMEGVIQ